MDASELGEAQQIRSTQDGDAPGTSAPNTLHRFCSLVVSSIRPSANEESLKLLFESAGKVLGCKLVRDSGSTQHTGIGFVMMGSQTEAELAAAKFHNFQVKLYQGYTPQVQTMTCSGQVFPSYTVVVRISNIHSQT